VNPHVSAASEFLGRGVRVPRFEHRPTRLGADPRHVQPIGGIRVPDLRRTPEEPQQFPQRLRANPRRHLQTQQREEIVVCQGGRGSGRAAKAINMLFFNLWKSVQSVDLNDDHPQIAQISTDLRKRETRVRQPAKVCDWLAMAVVLFGTFDEVTLLVRAKPKLSATSS
jgi:hypothetical protein